MVRLQMDCEKGLTLYFAAFLVVRVYRRNTEFSIKRDRNGRIHDDKLDTAENRL